MTSLQLSALASECTDSAFKDVFKSLSAPARIIGDNHIVHSLSEISDMQASLSSHITSNYIARYGNIETLDEAARSMSVKIVGDMYNFKTGIGTLSDPSEYTQSLIPIMMGPMEMTRLYSAGGLVSNLIDKKISGMLSQGITFTTFDDEFWDKSRLAALEESAGITHLVSSLEDAMRDAYIYGGAAIYPVFNTETYLSYMDDMQQMNLQKGCVNRWVEVDRWNLTYVPSYDVTSEDYLHPKSIYVPIGGIEVSTTRCALLTPKPQPYWSAICNIGWSPSDYCGWIRSLMGYQITVQAIPVMAQQMSLLLYRIPLEELNATLGTDAVKALMEINEEKMREWSAVNPKAVNMIGEVEVVSRTYSGFDLFLGGMKSDLAAQCGIPEPSIWHTPNKGFADNSQEMLMKESSFIWKQGQYIERKLNPIRDALIAHTFGSDSKEWANKEKIHINFKKPSDATEKDRAEIGARFAATISSLTTAGIPPQDGLKLATQFYPSFELTDDILNDVQKAYEEMQKMGMQQQMQSGGTGHSLASSGNARNIGHLGTSN